MVVAVYRSLLGRGPDPAGLAHWMQTGDLEQVITAVAATEEHRRRVRLEMAADGGDGDDGAGGRARRLEAGNGLVALDDEHYAPSMLTTFPWDEVADPWATLPTLVLGPYGRQLTAELARQDPGRQVDGGLTGIVEGARIGTLILTDPGYISALPQVRPDVLDTTLLRVVHPVHLAPDRPLDERELEVRNARRRLHALGFLEVSQVYARRHGGGTVVLDTTFTTPDPGDLLAVPGTPSPHGSRPACVWLVGRRVPVGDRA
jgi:hypothetical protein